MRSYGNLWQDITSEENLLAAWGRVKKGHANSRAVCEYAENAEANIAKLRRDLLSDCFHPTEYHQFKIFDPKPRTISCASIQDRIVHQALCGVITPLLERSFLDVSFACRRGYGSHRACLLARRYAARFPYFCKMDIRHYFDSIDHEILLGLLGMRFREHSVLNLIRKIVEAPVP